jgi:hypothetical protein
MKKYSIDITFLIFVPGFLSLFLYRIIPIQNVNPLSIVSVTASINSILWILLILQIPINYLLIKRFSFKSIVEINLFIILVYVITFKILIKALSLKGTPLPGSDIRGDLLTILNLAKKAELGFWSGGSYPPIWPSFIGNVARIIDVPVIALFKPAEFILLAISPLLVLFIWRLILEPWMALVITINLTLLYNFDYKSLTLNLIIPFFIYIIIKSRQSTTNNLSSYFFFGLIFGLVSLIYYGYIYWLIPLMIGINLLLFFLKNKKEYLKYQSYFYLGLGTGLGPVLLSFVKINIGNYYFIILLSLLFLYPLRKYKKVEFFFHLFINSALLLGLIGALLFYRAKDTWVEGGIEKNNPTVSSIMDLTGPNLFIFLVFLLGFYFIIKSNKEIIVLLSLVGAYISSILFMYFIASQMQVTSRVDLWPRAMEVQKYSLSLIFLIYILYLIDSIINAKIFKKYFDLTKQNFFYLLILILFFIGSYLVNYLGSSSYESMPYHSFNSAWYAHQGCSNPHEDPMLSKVFESNPDIQDFLRRNCPLANWPEITKLD